jgi:hypothetical protein
VGRTYGYPGDGINGFLGALDRAGGDPEFVQVRHEEMAPLDTFLVADGFSCRTQIEQAQDSRRAMHVAQLMQLELGHGPEGTPAGAPPEAACRRPPAGDGRPPWGALAAGAAAAALGGRAAPPV